MTRSTYEQLAPLVQEALHRGASMLQEWRCDPQVSQTLPYPHPQTQWLSTGPIVLGDVTPEMGIYGLDVFAPLMVIVPVRDIDQAIRYNHLCKYGLCASIFGREDQALSMAPEIRRIGLDQRFHRSDGGPTIALWWPGGERLWGDAWAGGFAGDDGSTGYFRQTRKMVSP